MTAREKSQLGRSQVFGADGHLSDAAVSAVADLQLDLLPREALSHADACADCSRRVSELTQLSLALDELVPGEVAAAAAALDAAPESVRAPRGWLAAIASGLALALLGAVPTLAALPRDLAGWRGAVQALPAMGRGGLRALAELDRGAAGAAMMVAAAALCVVGWMIARHAPQLRSDRALPEGVDRG